MLRFGSALPESVLPSEDNAEKDYVVMPSLRLLFGRRLKLLRRQSGFTQEQLGMESALSTDQIGLMERGQSAASFETLELLSCALNVPVRSLFDFRDLV